MPVPSNDTPLDGVIVVEHCSSVAGAYAGRMLALMGATVIKIERPGTKDAQRQPPFAADGKRGALFEYVNVNKSSVTLDVSAPDGLALLHELLSKADVFLDDTRPGDRKSLGITSEQVMAGHARLLYASILPFGAIGEHSEYLAYELNTLHSGGEGYLMPNGLALELFPERPPVKIYGQFAQFVGGTSVVCAILSGLLVQDTAGGQFLDVSVQDANVALSCFNIQRLGEGVLENRHGRSFKYGGVLECSDGYVGLLTLEQNQWEGLVKLMGAPAWTQEEWLKDPLARGSRGAEINKGIREWAKTQKVEDLVIRGQAHSVPMAKYVGPDEIMVSEQTKARSMFTDVEIAGVGKVPMLTAPLQFMASDQIKGYPAHSGADNEAVLCQLLGHSKADLERWTAGKVV